MTGRRHLVVVVPGIGGSVLAEPGEGPVVWDAGFADIADLLVRPGRMSVEENPQLVARGLIRSKRLVPGWTVIDGYDRLWKALKVLPGMVADDGTGVRVPGANLVAFGYDFRRSVVQAADRLAAEVDARLTDLGAGRGDRDKRVVVVAHSMGGLVARYWLGPLRGWPMCRALITLGTPHRGAPKALDVLVNGVRLAGQLLSRPSQLLAGWDAPYELLPRYPCVWDQEARVARYPHELAGLGLGARAKAAFAVHEDIAAVWGTVPRSGPDVQVRLGFSHPTLSSGSWDGTRLVVSKDRPGWLDLGRWDEEFGDGTVPAISALPVEMDGCDPSDLRVLDRHGRLASLGQVAGMLESYEGRPGVSAARGEERPVALGLDVAEWHPAGVPLPVRVRLHGVPDQDAAGVLVRARLHRDGLPAGRPVRLGWDPVVSGFVGDLAGAPPEMYEVRVDARAVPGGGDLDGVDAVAVVAGDAVD